MATNYIVVEIQSDEPLAQMTNDVNQATKAHETISALVNVLEARNAGTKSGTVKVVTKDSTTTIDTSGTGSASNTFTF